jgi:hypothetical protein
VYAAYVTQTVNDDIAILSDRQLMERILRELDHVDAQMHEVRQYLEEHKPLIERARTLLDSGGGWRAWRTGSSPKKSVAS